MCPYRLISIPSCYLETISAALVRKTYPEVKISYFCAILLSLMMDTCYFYTVIFQCEEDVLLHAGRVSGIFGSIFLRF